MPKVTFDIYTSLPPERVMSMLTDFSSRRPDGVGIKGKILVALVVLTRGANIRRKVFQRAIDRTLRQFRNS
jgi:hypothetical protein